MKGDNRAQKGEKRKGMSHQGRWSRGVDGTLRYRGVCPFNRIVCRLINVLTPTKATRKEV